MKKERNRHSKKGRHTLCKGLQKLTRQRKDELLELIASRREEIDMSDVELLRITTKLKQ